MKSARAFLPAALPLLFLACWPLAADTIYQTTVQGRQVVIQRQAIITENDSSFLVYKHFDLKDQRVEKVTLNQGSLRYTVERSKPAELDHIVGVWKKFGFTATVTDGAGKTTRLYDSYLDFYPPGGRGSLLESVPARTNVPILTDGGTPDEIDFSKIARIQVAGERLTVTLRNGRAESGKFLMPTEKPAEVRLLGITDRYSPQSPDVFDFTEPLNKLKEIRFE